jgi:hypothetical protein
MIALNFTKNRSSKVDATRSGTSFLFLTWSLSKYTCRKVMDYGFFIPLLPKGALFVSLFFFLPFIYPDT